MERGFTLSYFADGERRELINETENADLAVVLTDDGRRRVVTARAKTEVELAEYREELPFRVSRDGLCFANGYQSWTDSAERRLSEKERDVTRLPRPSTPTPAASCTATTSSTSRAATAAGR